MDGIYFKNITVGNITDCGSSKFVYVPPHGKGHCPNPGGATLFYVGMGYVGAITNPGTVKNVVVDGLHGIGPTGPTFNARGLQKSAACPTCAPIVNLTLRNINLQTGGVYRCSNVEGIVVEGVTRWPEGSTCQGGAPASQCRMIMHPGMSVDHPPGEDTEHSHAANATACGARCCASKGCNAWTFNSAEPIGSPTCAAGTACCWLKAGTGNNPSVSPKANCTSGVVQLNATVA